MENLPKDYKTDGSPSSSETFLSNFWGQNMTKTISPELKREYLPFIKSNFGKLSQREIARTLNLGRTTVNRWASELGFKFQKSTVNENFFDNFSEESTYLLGFIYADGNVAWNPQKSYHALTITSAAKDKKHLERIRLIISSTKPLVYSAKTNSYRLIVNSRSLCQKLIKLGVIPKKSLILKFPHFLPPEHLRHFLRGIIDGDGNVRYVERKRSPYFEITIASGSKEFCQGLIESVANTISVNATARKTNTNTYIIQYSCKRGEELANFIYSPSNIFLERKYFAYQKLMEEKKKHDE